MRRFASVAVLMLLVTGSAYGAPRESRDTPVLKVIKRVVKSLGDGIVIPLPPPKP
jgi:hypothetical protein